MVVSDLRALVSWMVSGRTKPLVALIQRTPESDHELLAVRVGNDPSFGRNSTRAIAVRTVTSKNLEPEPENCRGSPRET